MKIYFVGAHGTGKTTLARYTSERFRFPLISEVARNVLSSMEKSLEQILSDVNLTDSFQMMVWDLQTQVEKEYPNFVSDRAFDCVAYAALSSNVCGTIVSSDEFNKYMQDISEGIVFFVRPFSDKVKDDGVRLTEMADVYRIDGMIQLLLEMYDIDYFMISQTSLRDRIRAVESIVGVRELTDDSDRPSKKITGPVEF